MKTVKGKIPKPKSFPTKKNCYWAVFSVIKGRECLFEDTIARTRKECLRKFGAEGETLAVLEAEGYRVRRVEVRVL